MEIESWSEGEWYISALRVDCTEFEVEFVETSLSQHMYVR